MLLKNSKLYIHFFTLAYLVVMLLWFTGAQLNVFDFHDLNYSSKEYHFFPYIGIFLGSILDIMPKFLEELISIVIVPTGIFYLLTRIYSRHVNSLWTVFLALLSVSVFNEFPFRTFMMGNSIEVFDIPLITQYPFPGLSTLIFLLIYYFISQIKKLKKYQIILFTVLCSLFFYINALEALFLLSFWFLFFGSRKAKELGWLNKSFLTLVLTQMLIVIAVVFYGLMKGEVVGYQVLSYSQYGYYIIAYYVLPIVFMLMLYFIKRIDPYEIWFKFRHVYGFMAIEIGIVILSHLSIMPINTEILNSRISQFFLHLFYYTPVIYYLSRPYQDYHKGVESKPVMKKLRMLINKVYPTFEQIFTLVISLLLIIYNIYPLIIQWKA